MDLRTAFDYGLEYAIVHDSMSFEMKNIFADYITKIYNDRLAAKLAGNVCAVSFFKILMNSLYGKFG